MATKKRTWEAVPRQGRQGKKADQFRPWNGKGSRNPGEITRSFPSTPDKGKCTHFRTSSFDGNVDGRDDGGCFLQNRRPPTSSRDIFGEKMEVAGTEASKNATAQDGYAGETRLWEDAA